MAISLFPDMVTGRRPNFDSSLVIEGFERLPERL
jgi:hypothetical protein